MHRVSCYIKIEIMILCSPNWTLYLRWHICRGATILGGCDSAWLTLVKHICGHLHVSEARQTTCSFITFRLNSFAYQNSCSFPSILCRGILLCMYVYCFLLWISKRWLLFFIVNWLVQFQLTRTLGWFKVKINGEYFFYLYVKKSWTGTILCAIRTLLKKRKISIVTLTSQGGGLMLCGWSLIGELPTLYLPWLTEDFNIKNLNTLCIKCFLGPYFFVLNIIRNLSHKLCGSDCPLVFGRGHCGSGVAKQLKQCLAWTNRQPDPKN